jgi:hypothetical protein
LFAPVRSLLGQKLCEQFACVGQLPHVGLVTDFDHGIGQQMLAFGVRLGRRMKEIEGERYVNRILSGAA